MDIRRNVHQCLAARIPVGTSYLGLPANPVPMIPPIATTIVLSRIYRRFAVFARCRYRHGHTHFAVFDPTFLVNPVLDYSRWFVDRGTGTPNDTMVVLPE
jgi:hypothetical protein